jgi:hypothetical protein
VHHSAGLVLNSNVINISHCCVGSVCGGLCCSSLFNLPVFDTWYSRQIKVVASQKHMHSIFLGLNWSVYTARKSVLTAFRYVHIGIPHCGCRSCSYFRMLELANSLNIQAHHSAGLVPKFEIVINSSNCFTFRLCHCWFNFWNIICGICWCSLFYAAVWYMLYACKQVAAIEKCMPDIFFLVWIDRGFQIGQNWFFLLNPVPWRIAFWQISHEGFGCDIVVGRQGGFNHAAPWWRKAENVSDLYKAIGISICE